MGLNGLFYENEYSEFQPFVDLDRDRPHQIISAEEPLHEWGGPHDLTSLQEQND